LQLLLFLVLLVLFYGYDHIAILTLLY
jgi:hypothetical protein